MEEGEEERNIGEKREEKIGRAFLVSIKQLSWLGLSIPKLWTVYFVYSAVALCEITSA